MSSVSKPRVRQNRHKQGLNQTLEKISADFRIYMKGGALYYVLDYTGAQYGAKETGRKKLWIGNATRKVIKNYPEVINLSW